MSDASPAEYAALADRVEDAEQADVWDAFGEEMEQRAREGADDHKFAGFRMSVSPIRIGTGADLSDIIHVAYRQFGDSRSGLAENAVAEESDVYATIPTSVQNVVKVSRRAVVSALRDAADSEGSSEDGSS